MKCPNCGEECTQDMVDVGIGEMPCGPMGCENCHWVERPLVVHTCHGNEHMPPGPCMACDIERAEYGLEKRKNEAP